MTGTIQNTYLVETIIRIGASKEKKNKVHPEKFQKISFFPIHFLTPKGSRIYFENRLLIHWIFKS